MSNPRQLALQIQINERASLDNFFISKNNNKAIQILKNILERSNNGAQIFIDDLGSNGKSYLLQAICNDFSNSNNSTIYIPMQKAINLEPSILEGINDLNLICLDDIDLISNQRDWELALFNLINECYEKDCFLLLSGSIDKLEVIPDLISRIKKMDFNYKNMVFQDEEIEIKSTTLSQWEDGDKIFLEISSSIYVNSRVIIQDAETIVELSENE